MRYRAVLVEDEEHSLSRLRRLLRSFEQDVEIVGEASDGPSAVEVIRARAPDLLFLDIDLPGINAFEVLERLEQQPVVIFTTAFNQHALHAFKAHTVDYLLKPIEEAEIRRALDKLKAMAFNGARVTRAIQQILETSPTTPRYLTRIPCKVGDRTFLVNVPEILYFQSGHKYTSVCTPNNEFLIDTPLVELERTLNPQDFCRIHRATLVGVPWIAEIRRSTDGKLSVVLKDAKKTELAVSRHNADNLKNL